MSDLFSDKNAAAELKQQIIDLGPWHHDIQVTPEISTAVSLEKHKAHITAFSNMYRQNFYAVMSSIFPDGKLDGKSFLDCACNCGGYCFWAKELGATNYFGFDVRKHWIDQAEFLLKNRTLSGEGISIKQRDLYDVPSLNISRVDITLFKGIFYHLPDPITGLKIAADLTTDLLIFDSATRYGTKDGFLAVANEDVNNLMSGVHGLNWFPTGPEVIKRILLWMGFKEFRVLMNSQNNKYPTLGRLCLLAARTSGYFEYFDQSQNAKRVRL
ncbi:MAG: class I SAM-dependent methyltransferase [Methylococcales bacterium]